MSTTDSTFLNEGFEPPHRTTATGRAVENDIATAAPFAPEAARRAEVMHERSQDNRPNAEPNQPQDTKRTEPGRTSPSVGQARLQDRPRQPGGIPRSRQAPAGDRVRDIVGTRRTFAARPETSARVTGEPEAPDVATDLRDRVAPTIDDGEQPASRQRPTVEMRPAPARSDQDAGLPAPSTPTRVPAQARMQLPRPIQPANAGRPQAAPPAVHIGTLDIRIEAPKQRPQSPPRLPVSFRGSGILSRLYLRRV